MKRLHPSNNSDLGTVLESIKDLLRSKSVQFKEVHHQPTRTSRESALARGENLAIGGKALVLKVDDTFKLFVLSAARRLDSSAIKKHFHAKGIRFAGREELKKLTGLEPGSIPPFGRPIIDLELFVDESILNNAKIAFNAGSLTDSIVMAVKDYLQLAEPKLFSFSTKV